MLEATTSAPSASPSPPAPPGPSASWNGVTPPTRRGRSSRLIGDVVVDLGFADRETVEAAVAASSVGGKTTGRVLLDRGILRPDQHARVLAERFGFDYVDLSVYEVDMGAVALIGATAAKRYEALPIGYLEDRTLLVAMADPTNVMAVDDIAMITGLEVRPAAASGQDVRMLIARLNRLDESIQEVEEEPEAEIELGPTNEDAPLIKLVHSIIGQAVEQGASDIHFDPEEGDMRVLFRLDGVLRQSATVPRKMTSGVISRIKIMAEMDIAERRAPQDGRLAVTVEGRRVDLRAVSLPVVDGEAMILRVLDNGVVVRDLEVLGMRPPENGRFTRAISRPHGAVLVTGPTGSGKSTTLYAALSLLNTGDRSILTIEDPVESPLPGVKQMQIAPRAGVTFATGLRSMLRADPDVIMVGEIRDRETAQIAVEASLTGHLVLSTLHTNDAPSALTRLIDMGIEPFLIASAIDCVVAQRLARLLCTHCKRPQDLTRDLLAEQGLGSVQPYEGVGCVRCGGTGYRGRIGLYEVMPITEEIRTLVLERRSVDEIAAVAIEQGMGRLREDGLQKILTGQTSLAEVGRITSVG